MNIENLVEEIMKEDTASHEAEWARMISQLPSFPSGKFEEMMHKTFLAGCAAGAAKTADTFMLKVIPVLYNVKHTDI